MNRRLPTTCKILAAMPLFLACLSVDGKQASIRYPNQLIGVWQGDGDTCRLPGNLDSDTRMEIKPDKLIDYEQWNEPTVVLQISKKPLAWKIKSRLHIDEHVVDQYEIYALSGADQGVLTVVDESRSATYVRCT